MKLCIFGAGAIGGHIGWRLAAAGADVTFIARGEHLAQMRRAGLRLIAKDVDKTIPVRATDDPREAGPQDAVVIALKATALPGAVDSMLPLLGPHTAVVTAMNGVPYWYFHKHGGPQDGARLESADPGGRQWATIGPERAIGCVLWQAGRIEAPGVIRHGDGMGAPLGEPDGSASPRVVRLADAFRAAGLDAPVSPRIRDELWKKLWGNLSYNPVSVLTLGTLLALSDDPDAVEVLRPMMAEARAVGEKLGVHFDVDVETRIAIARSVGPHKTSMLQDLERGRALELDAIVGAIAEMGRLVRVPTPTVDTVYRLVRSRVRQGGLPFA